MKTHFVKAQRESIGRRAGRDRGAWPALVPRHPPGRAGLLRKIQGRVEIDQRFTQAAFGFVIARRLEQAADRPILIRVVLTPQKLEGPGRQDSDQQQAKPGSGPDEPFRPRWPSALPRAAGRAAETGPRAAGGRNRNEPDARGRGRELLLRSRIPDRQTTHPCSTVSPVCVLEVSAVAPLLPEYPPGPGFWRARRRLRRNGHRRIDRAAARRKRSKARAFQGVGHPVQWPISQVSTSESMGFDSR